MDNKNIFLDLYSPSAVEKENLVYHRLTGVDAYDGWHCLMYIKEIMVTQGLINRPDLKFADIPRKEKNVLFFLILKVFPHLKHITELGSSLFELIDGLEAVNKYFVSSGLKGLDQGVSGYKFTGIESSKFLRQIAAQLHHGYDLTLVEDYASAPPVRGVLYDRAVSSYAFTSAQDLADFINKFDFALLNLFVSKNETFVSVNAAGRFTYFSLKELVASLDQPLFHLFGYKSPSNDKSMGKPVIEGFFLYGPQEMAEKLVNESQNIPEIKAYFSDKEISLKDVRTLF